MGIILERVGVDRGTYQLNKRIRVAVSYLYLKQVAQLLKMEYITKPSMTRLARRAGVKSLADDCYSSLFEATEDLVRTIMETTLVINAERGTKTIMSEDIYDALAFLGFNVAQSTELSTTICTK